MSVSKIKRRRGQSLKRERHVVWVSVGEINILTSIQFDVKWYIFSISFTLLENYEENIKTSFINGVVIQCQWGKRYDVNFKGKIIVQGLFWWNSIYKWIHKWLKGRC